MCGEVSQFLQCSSFLAYVGMSSLCQSPLGNGSKGICCRLAVSPGFLTDRKRVLYATLSYFFLSLSFQAIPARYLPSSALVVLSVSRPLSRDPEPQYLELRHSPCLRCRASSKPAAQFDLPTISQAGLCRSSLSWAVAASLRSSERPVGCTSGAPGEL